MAISFINSTNANTTTPTLVCNKPTNTAQNDIMFAAIVSDGQAVSTPPSGWTSLGNATSAFGIKHYLYYKIAGSSEPSTYTWGMGGSAIQCIVTTTYRGGFNVSNPIDVVSNTVYNTNNTTCRAASMSVTNTNSALIFVGSEYGASATFTKPTVPTTGWVEDVDVVAYSGFYSLTFDSMVWSSSGATGNMDATMTTTQQSKHAFAVALNIDISAPTITTQAVTDKALTTGTGNGNITATGGENATRRGFCYMTGTSGDPTTANSVAYDDGSFGTGAYTKSITGLSSGTAYRVRAYAVNSAGTSYGTTVDYVTNYAYTKSLTEVITAVENVSKKPNKYLLETVTLNEIFARISTIFRRLTETITLVDTKSINMIFNKVLTETITLVDTIITKITAKILIEVITLVDIVTKQAFLFKSLLENIVLVDTISFVKQLVRAFTETITLVEADIKKTTSKIFIEVIPISDIFSRIVTYSKLFTETITLSETFTKMYTRFRTFTETITLVDTTKKVVSKIFSEIITLVQRFQGLLNGNDISYIQKYVNQAGTYVKKYVDQVGTYIKKYLDIP